MQMHVVKKGEGAGLWSDIKNFIRFLYFDPLATGPVHSCAILTPRSAYYSPEAISSHWTYGTDAVFGWYAYGIRWKACPFHALIHCDGLSQLV